MFFLANIVGASGANMPHKSLARWVLVLMRIDLDMVTELYRNQMLYQSGR